MYEIVKDVWSSSGWGVTIASFTSQDTMLLADAPGVWGIQVYGV